MQILSFLNRQPLRFFLLLASVLYFPLVFFGYGADNDSYDLFLTYDAFLKQHLYEPSRTPGFLVHEIPSTFLNLIGGSIATNLGTLAMSLAALYFFMKILEKHEIPNRRIIAVFFIIHPFVWVNSACTIDYFWALALILSGYLYFSKEKWLIASLLLGLSGGARLLSGLAVAAIFLTYYAIKPELRKTLVWVAFLTLGISAICYIPSFLWAGNSFKFLGYLQGDWTLAQRIGRFVYKNIYFWGLQTCVAGILLLPILVKGFRQNYEPSQRIIVVLSALVCLFYLGFFLKAPLENEYMIPLIPFALILLGISLKNRPKLLLALLLVQFSYNFVSLNLARPNQKNNATSVSYGVWLEKGYLLQDIDERSRWMNMQGYPDSTEYMKMRREMEIEEWGK